jgi:hypothetical protein
MLVVVVVVVVVAVVVVVVVVAVTTSESIPTLGCCGHDERLEQPQSVRANAINLVGGLCVSAKRVSV